jgi:outer membrane protein assembly factor BamB
LDDTTCSQDTGLLRYAGIEEFAMASPGNLFIGIKGTVLAIDRATGAKVWESPLKGGDFVNVVLDGGQLYAATRGELYCLDPDTGEIRWRNELSGMGWGLITIAQAGADPTAMEEKRRRDQADAVTTTAT